MNQNLKTIVDTISEQIQRDLASIASEEHHPSHNPDTSEDMVKALKERVSELRRLRTEVEIIFTNIPR